MGTLQAHAEALGAGTPDRWLHVVEEGVVLAQDFGPSMERLIAGGQLAPYDVVFTDVTLPLPHVVTLKNLKRAYDNAIAESPHTLSVMDLAEEKFAGRNSYLVNPAALSRLRSAMAAHLAANGGSTPEAYFRKEVREGRLRAACVFPYLTCAAVGRSGTDVGPHLLRLLFFADWRPDMVEAALASLGPAESDPRIETLSEVLGVMVAD
jgi:hypothetical protein